MADNDDWKNQALALAIIAFIVYASADVIKSFIGAFSGESSPLTPLAFLMLLLGFCTANAIIIVIGCVLVFLGTAHTRFMHGNR